MLSSNVTPVSSCSPFSPSSSFLTSTPRAVLGSICQYLRVVDLLRLFRSCSTLHRLAAGYPSFSRVAWSEARLHLALDLRVHEWAVRDERCVDGGWIPVEVWQQAVPIMLHTVEQWDTGGYEWLESVEKMRLRAALTAEPPTKSIQVGTEERIVLSQLSWDELNRIVPRGGPCFRSRLVLSATPQLRHLSVTIDPTAISPPPAADLVSFVPNLRSLSLTQWFHEPQHRLAHIRDTLTLLPNLRRFDCAGLLRLQDMIDMAAHATLESISVDANGATGIQDDWDGWGFDFNVNGTEGGAQEGDAAEESNGEMEEPQAAAAGDELSTDTLTAAQHSELDDCAENVRWLQSALVRVLPSRRSVTMRLALANFLHRQLQGEHIRAVFEEIDFYGNPLLMLRHFQMQIALLRSTLRSQLAFAASAAREDEPSQAGPTSL